MLQALVELYPLPHPQASVDADTMTHDTLSGHHPNHTPAQPIVDTDTMPQDTLGVGNNSDEASDLEELVESHIAGFTPQAKRLVRLMLIGYDLTPLLSRHMKPFHLLDRDARQQWNTSSASSRNLPRKEASKGLDTLIQLVRASTPEVKKLIGYDGRAFCACCSWWCAL